LIFDSICVLCLRTLKVTLLALLSLSACAVLSSLAGALEAGPGKKPGFDGLQFKILSPDGKETIGHTSFTVLQSNSTEEIKGETRYVDGEHDSEDVRLSTKDSESIFRLDTYEHSFFNADNTLHLVDTLDAKSGVASCTSYSSGSMKVRKTQLVVPADFFAGASGLMMMVGSLRHGNREIRFHAFACAPGPEIFNVEVSVPDRAEHWPFYQGELFRLDMRPDLGALNLLIAPFLPTMDAWFNPHDNWNYVGGEFDRYFRGPHVLTVRVPSAN
jgi:hypothetical protein